MSRHRSFQHCWCFQCKITVSKKNHNHPLFMENPIGRRHRSTDQTLIWVPIMVSNEQIKEEVRNQAVDNKRNILREMSSILDFETPLTQQYFRAVFEVALISLDLDVASFSRRIEKTYLDIVNDFIVFFDGQL